VRKQTCSRPGSRLSDVAIAIGVLAVLLAAVTTALDAIEKVRVNAAAERSVETRNAAIDWLSNGLNYAGISFNKLGTSKAKKEARAMRFSESSRTVFGV
jgi:hypothetical protein